MKSLTTVVAAATLAAPLVSALALAPRSASLKTLSLPIERRQIPDILAHEASRLGKRQTRNTVEETLDNEETLYFANLTLGTPPQSLRLHLDTGSSDLWVNTASSSFCQSGPNVCEGGTFDSSQSSTFKVVNSEFNITYVDGSGATGNYVSDTLRFAGVTLSAFQFGIGDTSSSKEGVLGIGYTSNEVQADNAGFQPYPNLPQALADNGHIASNAYSLWLNDLDASTGEILFGGVNTAKYAGDLATVPILQTSGDFFDFSIALTGLTNAGSNLSSSSFPAAVLLDSGATLTYLPDDVVQNIYNQVQAVYSADAGAAYVACDAVDLSSTLDFEFSSQTIRVPYDELLLNAGTTRDGQPLTLQNGQAECLFGIAPAQGGFNVLGDTFLRSAYVVYDLGNNEISLAQTIFNATADNIQAIGAGSNSVPNATPVANPITNIAGSTGTSGGGFNGGATSEPTSTSSSSIPDNAAPSNSAPMAAVMAAVIGIAALML